MEMRLRERRSSDDPNWDQSQGEAPRPATIIDAMVSLQTRAWLPSESPNKQLTEIDVDTYIQPMD